MAEIDSKTTPEAAIPSVTGKPTGKSADIKALDYVLRDERGLGPLFGMDSATERVWRNCRYPVRVTFEDYYRMYSRNNVAARVIETFPDYTWSAIPFVTDKGGAKGRFAKSVSTLLSTHYKLQDGVSQSLLSSMKQLDVLGGIGGESLLVFGFSDSGTLSSKVSGASGTKISWIKILHNGQFEVEARNEDSASTDFGDVVLYKTKAFSDNGDLNFASQIAPGVSIHASRCVHFKESNGLSYGTSRIQKCYNQLLDITKLAGASAEVYWLGAFSGLAIESDPNATVSDDAYLRMKQETRKYFDGLERSLIFDGATSKLLYPAIVSPKDHFDLQITMISIATAVPRRFLTGAEAAKLASQQDTLNWDTRVINRRETFSGPRVVSPVVQRCIDAGVIQRPSGDTFGVIWPRVQSVALNERADAARNMTAAWQAYGTSGLSKVMSFGTYLLYACGFGESEALDIESKIQAGKWAEVEKLAAAAKAPSQTSGAPGKTDSPDKKDMSDLEERVAEIEARMDETPTPSSVSWQDRPENKNPKRIGGTNGQAE
jgi:hypothetical protein